MKASELVEELQTAIATYGDVPVVVVAPASHHHHLAPALAAVPMHGIRFLADDQADPKWGTHEAVYPHENLPDDPRLEPVILISPETKE